MAASFLALKNERVYRTVYATKAQVRPDVLAYIAEFYNSRRRHSALGYTRPNEFHNDYRLIPNEGVATQGASVAG